jgi:hypothetical protein
LAIRASAFVEQRVLKDLWLSATGAVLNGGRRSRELISPGGIRSYALPVQMNKLKAHPLSCMRYVVLPVDLLGVVRATYELECADDNDANLRAQPYLEAHSAIEIWRGRRCIAYLARKRGPIEASPIAVFDTEDGLSSLPAVEKNKISISPESAGSSEAILSEPKEPHAEPDA